MDRYADYRAVAADLGVDAIALVPGPNFNRVLGHGFMSHERPFVLVIPVEGAPAAIVPNLELKSWDLVGFEGATIDWRDQDGYAAAFGKLARHLPLRSVAVEGQVMRVFVHHALTSVYPNLRVVDGEKAISNLRAIKTADDLVAMDRAIKISEAALHEVIPQVRVGQTEKQVEKLLMQALFEHGCEGMAFAPIVTAADNSARPHGHARFDYMIKKGDALLFDFGAVYGGFCADITRTFFVGDADAEQRAVYDTVLQANLKGLEVTRDGISAHELDDAVISVLEASPYAAYIRTKTGHGLGREVHEAPYIMRGNHEVLRAGMVYTNEPGLYLDGKFGVRIEDDVLVTEDGYRCLTSFPKELQVIG